MPPTPSQGESASVRPSARILVAGVSDATKNLLSAELGEWPHSLHSCDSDLQLKAMLRDAQPGEASRFQLIVAGPAVLGSNVASVGAGLLSLRAKAAHEGFSVIFVADTLSGWERSEVLKAGFQSVFVLPTDQIALSKAIHDQMAIFDRSSYVPIKLVDIEPNTRLQFQISVFLPANNKFIVYAAAGDVIDEARLQRLKSFKQKSIYVPVEQLQSFHNYSATRLSELLDEASGGGSKRERSRTNLRESVRELLDGAVTDSIVKHMQPGKSVTEHSRLIVENFLRMKEKPGACADLLRLATAANDYSHVDNTTLFACLFGMLDPRQKDYSLEEIAVAARLHDTGLDTLPEHLRDEGVAEMTAADTKLFENHPRASRDIIRRRFATLPDSIAAMVFQHHERLDGSGFPEKLSASAILPGSQVIATADRFDCLTRAALSLSPLSSDQAIRQIEKENVASREFTSELRLIFDREVRAAG